MIRTVDTSFLSFHFQRGVLFLAVVVSAWGVPADGADPVVLAENGLAKMPVVIAPDASESVQASAKSLAIVLGRLSGAEFEVTGSPAAASSAIRLTVADGPPPSALDRESYTLRSGADGLSLTGATDLALRHAVWDLLHRLGYRQFFPGKTWEVVPKTETLAIAVDASESPAYANRRIWYGYGIWEDHHDAYADWVEKNRMGGGFVLNTGHAYGALIRSQQKAFDAHPEYYALIDGERRIDPESKLCISHPGVRAAAAAYALEFFGRSPDADSVSMDPSDGGGWCQCDACVAMGTPSDRASLLANSVAEVLEKRSGPDRFVGMYAYNYHSEPPSVPVHPKVVISVATDFIKGELGIDDLLAGWAVQGASLGIREYYSVSTWDRDMPGAAKGSRLAQLAETIPAFHAKGARFLSAESSENWGPNGLGYYLASRVMWDLSEAARREAIVEDFLDRAFGPAKEPMRRFYARLDGDNAKARLVFGDLLARSFRDLAEARDLVGNDPAIRARLDDLALYLRYVELFNHYRTAKGPERQTAYEAMIRHAYRMRGTFMVHSLALYRDVASRDRELTVPENARWQVPEAENPWKSSEPFTVAEIGKILATGIASHEPVELGFEPREYDDTTLAPAASRVGRLPDLPHGEAESARGRRSWFTVVEKTPATLELNVAGGLIAHYRDRGNVKIRLWKLGGASATGEAETLAGEDESVPPDGEERTVKLAVAEAGIYRIDLDDGNDLTRVRWPEGQPMSWKMSLDDQPRAINGRWTLYAWVPPGTKQIGLYSEAGAGDLLRPDGEKALNLARQGGAFLVVGVPEGQDGGFWKFDRVNGKVSLLTIPPFLARHPSELVVPAP